jgi:hypothetical protein
MGTAPSFRDRPPAVTFVGYPPLKGESFSQYEARVVPLIMSEVFPAKRSWLSRLFGK